MIKHGHTTHTSQTKEYRAWADMKNRCYNTNILAYPQYGGRGIKVCKKWKNSFEQFLNDIGLAPSKAHTLDRINNNGDYKPSNCKWSTQKEQANNKRIPNRLIPKTEHLKIIELVNSGKKQTDIARLYNVSKYAIYNITRKYRSDQSSRI